MATMTFGFSSSVVNSNHTFNGADADMTSLLQWASVTYQALIFAQPPTVRFTGSIAGTTLTVTAVASSFPLPGREKGLEELGRSA